MHVQASVSVSLTNTTCGVINNLMVVLVIHLRVKLKVNVMQVKGCLEKVGEVHCTNMHSRDVMYH